MSSEMNEGGPDLHKCTDRNKHNVSSDIAGYKHCTSSVEAVYIYTWVLDDNTVQSYIYTTL